MVSTFSFCGVLFLTNSSVCWPWRGAWMWVCLLPTSDPSSCQMLQSSILQRAALPQLYMTLHCEHHRWRSCYTGIKCCWHLSYLTGDKQWLVSCLPSWNQALHLCVFTWCTELSVLCIYVSPLNPSFFYLFLPPLLPPPTHIHFISPSCTGRNR